MTAKKINREEKTKMAKCFVCDRELKKFNIKAVHKKYGEPYEQVSEQLCVFHYEMYCHYFKMFRSRRERYPWLVNIIKKQNAKRVAELGCGGQELNRFPTTWSPIEPTPPGYQSVLVPQIERSSVLVQTKNSPRRKPGPELV